MVCRKKFVHKFWSAPSRLNTSNKPGDNLNIRIIKIKFSKHSTALNPAKEYNLFRNWITGNKLEFSVQIAFWLSWVDIRSKKYGLSKEGKYHFRDFQGVIGGIVCSLILAADFSAGNKNFEFLDTWWWMWSKA